jgi:hypothetical protein
MIRHALQARREETGEKRKERDGLEKKEGKKKERH